MMTRTLSLGVAALIFSGPLSIHLAAGIGMMLSTAVVTGLVVAGFSSYAGTVAIPQDRIAPILALLAGVIASRLPGDTDPSLVFYTVTAAIILSTLITGGVLAALGSEE